MAAKRITEIFAFVTIDHDDDEGITGFMGPDKAWMPMVGADMDRVAALEDIAQRIANIHGREIRVVKFSGPPEVIKVITPQNQGAPHGTPRPN